MTMAIAHVTDDKLILDVVREMQPPFSPESVIAEFARVFKQYRVSVIEGDRWAEGWARDALQRNSLNFSAANRTKAEIYLDALPLLNSGRVLLLDNDRLIQQIASLERRPRAGGRDEVDHPKGGHDDVANSALGALVLLISSPANQWLSWATKEREEAERQARHSHGDEQPPPVQNKQLRPKPHPMMPDSMIGNSQAEAYWSVIAAHENRPAAMATPRCSHCGEVTIGSRLTDGVSAWCNAVCQVKWTQARVEQNRARAAVERGARPPSVR
jgi:hypothetical protein